MPLPIMLAHKLARGLSERRRDGSLAYPRPDGKSQVTVVRRHEAVRVDAVVVSSQHSPDVSQEQMRADITEKIIKAGIPANLMDENTKIYVNPTGRFVVGGPTATPASPDARSSSTPTAATAARRRRVLGQGSNQGGSVGLLA
jgi:S-adenosylmethionine synthetase